MRQIKKGSTDQSIVIRIIDSTDGTPETAVAHDTAGIDLWYRREGATKTSITEAALAALDSAHSDGGIEPIGDGYYRLDLPDAAVASGVNGVMVGGTVTGMIVIGCYIMLTDFDPYDTVRMGMTALPNAAADAAGGLPISDDGELDLDAILALLDDARGEPGDAAPPVNPDLATKIDYLYKFMRNKIETTDSKIHVYNDAQDNKDHTANIEDNGTTFTRGEFGAGD